MKILKQALKTAALAAVVFSSQILAPVASLAGLTLLSSPAHADVSRICLSTDNKYIIETNYGAPCSKLFFIIKSSGSTVVFRDGGYICNKVGRWYKTDDFGQSDDNICNGMTKTTNSMRKGYYHASMGYEEEYRNACSSGDNICEDFADEFHLVNDHVYNRYNGESVDVLHYCTNCLLVPY